MLQGEGTLAGHVARFHGELLDESVCPAQDEHVYLDWHVHLVLPWTGEDAPAGPECPGDPLTEARVLLSLSDSSGEYETAPVWSPAAEMPGLSSTHLVPSGVSHCDARSHRGGFCSTLFEASSCQAMLGVSLR